MAINTETFDTKTAPREQLIETKYIGTNPTLKGREGEAWLLLADNQWMFRPNGSTEEYRVDGNNLDCNVKNGWLRASYLGKNNLWGLSRNGKAQFDETENSWVFKPKGSKELFRVGENSLKFIRDTDLTSS